MRNLAMKMYLQDILPDFRQNILRFMERWQTRIGSACSIPPGLSEPVILQRTGGSDMVPQYLYMEGADYIFMNQETFDQIPIAHDLINGVDFLLEGMVVDVVSDASTETVLFADVPVKVQMKITYTEPGLKGDTATNTLKPATVESGATVRVPLFINEGETIEIDTRDGSYVGRVKA